MTTIEERLRDSYEGLYCNWGAQWACEQHQIALAARGLAVVDVSRNSENELNGPDSDGMKSLSEHHAELVDYLHDCQNAAATARSDYRGLIADLLHLLETAEGYWVTDKAEFPKATLVMAGKAFAKYETLDEPLVARKNTYHRQTFKDTDAVKRAREMMQRDFPVRSRP